MRKAPEEVSALIERHAASFVGDFDAQLSIDNKIMDLYQSILRAVLDGIIQINYFVVDEKLRVEVTDEGGGVPFDQRNNLFRRFSHVDTSNERARQGAGLGLSVVKAIVEAQQGEVGIVDSPEGGNSFWFTLPLANESHK